MDVTMFRDSLKCKIYGDSYIEYTVWSVMQRVQCMETHIEGAIFGDSYRGYNVCKP